MASGALQILLQLATIYRSRLIYRLGHLSPRWRISWGVFIHVGFAMFLSRSLNVWLIFAGLNPYVYFAVREVTPLLINILLYIFVEMQWRLYHRQPGLGGLLEAAEPARISIDAQGRVIGWDAIATAMFGYETEGRHGAMGRPLTELIIPERYARAHIDGMAGYLQSGPGTPLPTAYPTTARHRDGTEFHVEISVEAEWAETTVRFKGFVRRLTYA